MDVRISHHLNPLSQTNTYKHIKSSGCVMLISQTWQAHERKDTKLSEQKQQQEHIGGSNRTGEFHKQIVTTHMCFTVESGPGPTGTRTKTTSRAIFGIPLHTEFSIKTKSRRKATIFFHQFQTSAADCSVACAGGEAETIYIRSSMEEDEALLEMVIEASYTPTRSPRQINQNSLRTLSWNRKPDQENTSFSRMKFQVWHI